MYELVSAENRFFESRLHDLRLAPRREMRSATSSPASLRMFCTRLTNSRAVHSAISSSSSWMSSPTPRLLSMATTTPSFSRRCTDDVGQPDLATSHGELAAALEEVYIFGRQGLDTGGDFWHLLAEARP